MTQKKKKTLKLEEGTVRRMMTFANIGGLSDKFIAENYGSEEEMDEVKTKDQSRAGNAPDRLDENPNEKPEGEETAPPPEAPVAEPPPPPAPAGGGNDEMVQQLIQTIANALQDQYGVAINVSGGSEGGAPEGGMPPMPPEGGEGSEMPGSDDEMFETLASKLGYVKEQDGSFRKNAIAEGKEKQEEGKEKIEEEEELDEEKEELEEDAAQEKKQGTPKAGSHEKVEGAESPKKISTDDPKAKPVKEKKLPTDMGSEPLAEAVYKKVLAKLSEDLKKAKNKKNLPELTEEEKTAALLEAQKAKAQKTSKK